MKGQGQMRDKQQKLRPPAALGTTAEEQVVWSGALPWKWR